MEVYSMTLSELENHADTVKVSIMKSLVIEGKFTAEEADEWCKTHTVIFRKKGFFRTLSDLWSKEKVIDGIYGIVVKEI